jgi:hypothetical protein
MQCNITFVSSGMYDAMQCSISTIACVTNSMERSHREVSVAQLFKKRSAFK